MQAVDTIVGELTKGSIADDGTVLGLTIAINSAYNAPISVSADGTKISINVKGLEAAARTHIQELLTKSGYPVQR